MATQAERRTRTRAALLDAASDLFARQGFDDTSVAEILDAAGVSKGAMYHHFAGKEELFAAVFVTTSTRAIRRSSARIDDAATPLEALRQGCLAWVEVATEPATARILLVDGPAALGWRRCRELEGATSLGVMRRAIAAAAEAGEIEVPSIELAAQLLNALLAEAALARLAAHDRDAPHDVDALVTAMLRGLTPSG
jgi:AcrR family transcriptional regulator